MQPHSDMISCFEVGMTLLVDQSGRLFTNRKCSIKDILINREVWCVGGTNVQNWTSF